MARSIVPRVRKTIAENYLRFISVYERAEAPAAILSAQSTQGDPMKMRQSLADLERAFVDEVIARPPAPRLAAAHVGAARAANAKPRSATSAARSASLLLVLTLILTAVIVTVVMFRTLYLLLG